MTVIVAYDPRWPALFEEERARLLATTGTLLVAIEHIGSTAVPGLAANPIIDIMGEVRELEEVTRCVAALEGIGYEYVPQSEVCIPEFYRIDSERAEGMPDTPSGHSSTGRPSVGS